MKQACPTNRRATALGPPQANRSVHPMKLRSRRGKFSGKRMGVRIEVVQALLNSGASKSKIAKDLKISRNTIIAIEQRMKSEGVLDPQRVERIKETFRDKATYILDDALGAVSTRKLRASSAADCMKVAERAQQMAGLEEKPSGIHGQLLVLQQFNLRQGLPSISALDQASSPPKQPPTLASEADSGTADVDGQFELDP